MILGLILLVLSIGILVALDLFLGAFPGPN